MHTKYCILSESTGGGGRLNVISEGFSEDVSAAAIRELVTDFTCLTFQFQMPNKKCFINVVDIQYPCMCVTGGWCEQDH